MKAMKGLSMGKVLGGIRRKPTVRASDDSSGSSPAIDASAKPGESPEATAARCVRAFCMSGGHNANGDEVTYLPSIVDAAESSPAAAVECARLIRKFLYMENWSKPSLQYNAIMLLRILGDNPGPVFTRNINQKFVSATQTLLRSGRDPSVRMLLMETLDAFEQQNSQDEGLSGMIAMWVKEKEKAYQAYGGRPIPGGQQPGFGVQSPSADHHAQNYFSRSHHQRSQLPNPVELANRLEEARTSAKLLEQVVACTLPTEVLSNDLIKEFADRCLSASRSIQGYMSATDPAPDTETMESLIDTNEQLQQALNLHHRAMLYARKQLGEGNGGQSQSPTDRTPDATQAGGQPTWQAPVSAVSSSSRSHTPLAQVPTNQLPSPPSGKGKAPAQDWSGPSASSAGAPRNGNGDRYGDDSHEDPFRDPEPSHDYSYASGSASGGGSSAQPLTVFRPTESYLGRQDSAMNKVQMHGGLSPDDGETAYVAPKGPPPGRYDQLEAELTDDDDVDRYNATPKKEGQVFRY